jgi:hypothetical protein
LVRSANASQNLHSGNRLTMVNDGRYAAAMANVDVMTEFVGGLEKKFDVGRNMDW